MNDRMLAGLALAPAKVNLGLEVTGRRPDGYHDIATIMQSVSLFDRVSLLWPGHGNVVTTGAAIASEDNLVSRAARLMASAYDRTLDVDFVVQKRIPLASGLGGGSADAAAAIRLLTRYWNLAHEDGLPAEVAAHTGSDVPFFLTGGRALIEGRGEQVRSLPLRKAQWVVIVAPPVSIPHKTATLYRSLEPEDLSDGHWVRQLAGSDHPPQGFLPNAFFRPLAALHPEVHGLHSLGELPGVVAHSLSGAGPAYLLTTQDLESAIEVAWNLRALETMQDHSVRMARTISGPGPLTILRNRAKE